MPSLSIGAVASDSLPQPAQSAVHEPAADAMDTLRRIVRSLRVADAASEMSLGVSSAQLFVLRELEKAGKLAIGELAQRTATAQSSVSEVVARLSAKALIVRERSLSDRRRSEVSLSSNGRILLRRANETVQEKLLEGFSRLPILRQELIAAGLQAWIEASGLANVEPTMFFEP